MRSARDGKEHVSVRIQKEEYEGLRAYLLQLACSRTLENLRWELSNLPFEPYSAVRRQYRRVLREMNALRRSQGQEPIPVAWVPGRRRTVKTFSDVWPLPNTAGAWDLDEAAGG